MAVTRIKNNQITDASAGNAQVGVNAAVKLQNYTVTATKIANNLVYGSDLTVTGNLTVQGNTTTIDTTITTIEDPVILLASTQTTGTPTVDIGFVGARGNASNIAFVWDESASEFITAFTSTGETNTTITVSSYSNFHTNDANIGGNIVINGTTSLVGNVIGAANFTGNITGGNLLTPGLVSATGNVRGGNINTAGAVSATANVTGGNVLTGGLISATSTITSAANITGGNLLTGGLISATSTITGGNLATGGTVSATGNVTGGNVLTGGLISATSTITSAANITGGNLLTGGLISATSTITSAANVIGGNISTAGLITATGNITGGNLLTSGSGGAISGSGNITGGNILTGGVVSATGNVTGNYFFGNGSQLTGVSANTSGFPVTAGTSNIAAPVANGNIAITVAGTANVAVFASTGEYITGLLSATGNITSGNLLTGGLVSATANVTGGNLTTAGLITATGNVTGGNVLTGGLISATSTITSAANITGANITTGGLVTATGNVTGGNVTTGGLVTATGNVTGGNVLTAGVMSSTGNITGGNLLTGGLISATSTITSTANITGGNILTSGLVSATGNVTGGNILTAGQVSATGDVVTAGNLSLTGNIVDSGALTISTASGNLNLEPAGNIVLGNRYINGVQLTPVQNSDVASKYYVDLQASTALTYHAAVAVATTANLATTTGGTITYNQPNGAGNGIGATLTTTGSFNLIDTANVQTVGTRILVKNEANAVFNGIYVWSNATVITRSTDADEYGPNSAEQLSINDYFFVQGGNVNLGSAYVVDSPSGTITFGTSNIQFAQFSQAQIYSANTSAGLVLNAQTFSAKVDNNTTAFDLNGNISVKAGANLTTPNIGAATGTSLSVTGAVNAGTTMSATGNITGGNVLTGGLISATSSITSAANITGGNVLTGGLISSTGNVTGGNVLTGGAVSATANVTGGNVLTGGLISATSTITSAANITGGNILTTGQVSATGNGTFGNISTAGTFSAASLSASGNITGGNLLTGGLISATSTITSAANITGGNLLTGGLISATSTITSAANITGGNVLTGGLVSSTGNVTGGNVLTGGLISATSTITSAANITGGNLLTGGLISATSTITSAANITGGNVLTGGLVSATGNVTGGNLLFGSGIVSGTGNIYANKIFANISGNIDAAGANTQVQFADTGDLLGASANFTFDKSTNTMTVSNGNIIGGNLLTGGLISATSTITSAANITGGNLLTGGLISATSTITSAANVVGGNISTAGLITATGNVTGGNINTAGLITATGNITGANLILTSGTIDGPASGRITINGSDADVDFAVDGDTSANVFYVDAGTGTASFGASTQVTNAIVNFATTNSIKVPVGNTAQRPSTGVTGMMRFNSTNNNIEVYDNSEWTAVGVPSFTVIADEQFAGDGANTVFTLTNGGQTTNSCIVSINGVVQIPTLAYAVSGAGGNVLTFTEAPATGDVIDVRQITTTTTVTSISNSSGNAVVAVSDTTNDVSITGDLVPTGNLTQNLGTSTNRWSNLWVGGNTIFMGNLQLKENPANTFAVYLADGITQANIDVGNVDVSAITSGTSAIGIYGTGQAYMTVNGNANVLLVSNTSVQVAGVLSATGNVIGSNLRTAGDVSATGFVFGNIITSVTGEFGIPTGCTVVSLSNAAAQTVWIGAGNATNVYLGNASSNTRAGGNVLAAGYVSAVGNVTGNYILGNGALLTGVITSVANINSGTSNVTVVSSGGNITVGVGGTANVAEFSTGGLKVTGLISASGNITGGNLIINNNATITGNLTVNGTETIFNVANLTVNDKDIIVANNVTGGANVNGAGLQAGNPATATWFFNNATTSWQSNIGITPTTNGTLALGGASNYWGTAFITTASVTGNVTGGNILTAGLISATGNVNGGNLNVTGNIVDTGALSIITGSNGNLTLNAGTGFIIASSSILNGQANGTGNIGNSTGYFNTIFAKATSAQYADLAEKYSADADYEPGTVVMFGGAEEVTICSTDACRRIAGVISTNPSYRMNDGLVSEHTAMVALTGRVPTKVTGTVRKGDLMVSAGNGRARAEADPKVGTVIGKALADSEGDAVIEVVVGRV